MAYYLKNLNLTAQQVKELDNDENSIIKGLLVYANGQNVKAEDVNKNFDIIKIAVNAFAVHFQDYIGDAINADPKLQKIIEDKIIDILKPDGTGSETFQTVIDAIRLYLQKDPDFLKNISTNLGNDQGFIDTLSNALHNYQPLINSLEYTLSNDEDWSKVVADIVHKLLLVDGNFVSDVSGFVINDAAFQSKIETFVFAYINSNEALQGAISKKVTDLIDNSDELKEAISKALLEYIQEGGEFLTKVANSETVQNAVAEKTVATLNEEIKDAEWQKVFATAITPLLSADADFQQALITNTDFDARIDALIKGKLADKTFLDEVYDTLKERLINDSDFLYNLANQMPTGTIEKLLVMQTATLDTVAKKFNDITTPDKTLSLMMKFKSL